VSWDESGSYPLTGQTVPGVNDGTSPICGFHPERGRACRDAAPLGATGKRTSGGNREALSTGARRARNESEHKSERQRRANEQSAAAGKVNGGGMRPFGYAQDRRTVVTEEAGIVQECAERVLAGDSLRGVARELRARGAPTSAGQDWQPRSLRQVLVSARISGRRERHD